MLKTSSKSRVISFSILLVLAIHSTTGLRGQNITDTSNGALAAAVALGTLTPSKTSTVTPGTVQFRLRNNNDTGYHLTAMATVMVGNTASLSGGDSLGASDIGIGITSIAPSGNVLMPRSDVIAPGFNYDPTTVPVFDGLTPYGGAASGRATLSDLAVSRTILTGSKIFNNSNPNNPQDFLTVTMKMGILPQYFTPCTFSAVVTLTISNGP